MALKFIFGNSGSGKSDYLFQQVIEMEGRQPSRNYFVVVPEQFTLQTQKELVSRHKNQVNLHIDVVSFGRLAYRVFSELGKVNTVLEETGKSLVLRRIAEEKEKELTVLKSNVRKMGYIDQVKSLISEFMQYDISAMDLENHLAGLQKESALFYKLSDILLIYREFESYLAGGTVTAEQILDVLIDIADRSELLRGSVFVFDGFTGFTPTQMKLVRKLMQLNTDIIITVTIDVREEPFAERGIQDLFYMSRKMIHTVRKMAEEEGFEQSEPVFLEENSKARFSENPVLLHLEQNLFRPIRKQYKDQLRGEAGKAEPLGIFSLPTPRDELNFAASEICRMIQDFGYHFRDFAIVSGNAECYDKYAESVFQTYGIPFFSDMKKTILFHPFTELIRSVLEIVETDYSSESIFRYLKTGMAGFQPGDIDLLENYVIAKGIRGHKRWNSKFIKPFRGNGRMERGEEEIQEELARLNVIRELLVEQIEPLYESFRNKEADVSENTRNLYGLIVGLSAEQQLDQEKERSERAGNEAQALVNSQIYRIVMDLLDKVVSLLGKEKLSIREYSDILDAGFAASGVGIIPPGNDCVILGDIERTRLDGIKVLFFLGVNDGIIPQDTDRGGILSQYDREKLEQEELELAPTAREQAFIQKFYLYLSLTKPSDALYLTYARISPEGKSLRPSYLNGVLKSLFLHLPTKEIEADQTVGIITPKSALQTYISGLSAARKGDVYPEWKVLHQWYMGHPEWAGKVSSLFRAAFFSYQPENLSQDTALRLYGSVLTNSVTRLELFAGCAFAHFLQYGLKLSEREQYAFASVDMGSMFHDILQKYSSRLADGEDWLTISEECQDSILLECMEEIKLGQTSSVLFETARSEYVFERVHKIMKRSIWALTEQIRRGKFRPEGYEVDFMRVASLEASDLMMPEERKMRLVGRIDRVDSFEQDEQVYIRIIDYKSGNKDFELLNLYYGLQLQLVIYMDAAMEKFAKSHPGKVIQPGGIFYYHLDDPMIDAVNPKEEDIMEEILAKLRLKGLVNLEPEAYRNMDFTCSGKSSVIPLTLKSDGSVNSRGTSGTAKDGFRNLSDFVSKKINEFGRSILGGDICVSPYSLDKSTGCDYCPYGSICGMDLKIPGYRYRELAHISDEDIWEKLKDDQKKSEEDGDGR